MSQRRVTVNLSPASMPKIGTGFDLAIVVAVARRSDGARPRRVARTSCTSASWVSTARCGRCRGVLPLVLAAARAGVPRTSWCRSRTRPRRGSCPACGCTRWPTCRTLVQRYARRRDGPWRRRGAGTGGRATRRREAGARPRRGRRAGRRPGSRSSSRRPAGTTCCSRVRPAPGKTMLAERLPGLLPPTRRGSSRSRSRRSTRCSGARGRQAATVEPRPRSSRRTTARRRRRSSAAAAGTIRPGAISQAHHGVLFLDEAPEFTGRVLAGAAAAARVGRGRRRPGRATAVRFPARFQLVMAANPCPCGLGCGKGLDCTCTPMAPRATSAG